MAPGPFDRSRAMRRAVGVGFEPTVTRATTVFKTVPLGRSGNPPSPRVAAERATDYRLPGGRGRAPVGVRNGVRGPGEQWRGVPGSRGELPCAGILLTSRGRFATVPRGRGASPRWGGPPCAPRPEVGITRPERPAPERLVTDAAAHTPAPGASPGGTFPIRRRHASAVSPASADHRGSQPCAPIAPTGSASMASYGFRASAHPPGLDPWISAGRNRKESGIERTRRIRDPGIRRLPRPVERDLSYDMFHARFLPPPHGENVRRARGRRRGPRNGAGRDGHRGTRGRRGHGPVERTGVGTRGATRRLLTAPRYRPELSPGPAAANVTDDGGSGHGRRRRPATPTPGPPRPASRTPGPTRPATTSAGRGHAAIRRSGANTRVDAHVRGGGTRSSIMRTGERRARGAG